MRLRFPLWLAVALVTVCGAAAVGTADASGAPSDVGLFARAGSTLLSSHWRHAFRSYEVQAGPLELILASVARSVGHGQVGWAIALDVLCTAAMVAGAVVVVGRKPLGLAVFAVGAYVLWLPGAGYLGHPAEPLIAVLWLLAAREARRGRPTLAGALVGVSACLELWGILGVTVLALAPRLRRCAPGAVLAAALPVAALLPFVLGGDFGMLHYAWYVKDGVPRLLFGAGRPFTWPMRVGEGAVVCAVGIPLARAVRRSPEAVWLVPAAVALVRLALEPLDYGYYWDTVLVLVLIAAARLLPRRRELAERLGARRAATAP